MWSEKNMWQWKQDQWGAIRLALKEEEGGPWAKQDLDPLAPEKSKNWIRS